MGWMGGGFGVLHHQGFGVLHYQGFGVVHHQSFGVLHYQGFGVLHHQGFGVLHHQAFGVLHHQGFGVLHHQGFGVLRHQGFGVLHQLCPLQVWITVRWAFSSQCHCACFVYIKLLSTGACAAINIREIMLISIISSVSWTLQRGGGVEGKLYLTLHCCRRMSLHRDGQRQKSF